MKNLYLFLTFVLVACSASNTTNPIQLNSSSTSSELITSVSSSSFSTSSNIVSSTTFSERHALDKKFLKMPKLSPDDFIDIAIPILNDIDFESALGEITLSINKNVNLAMYTKETRVYTTEAHRNWEFDQDKYIYSSGELLEFEVLDEIQKQDLKITKIRYQSWNGTALEYLLKYNTRYMYIRPSSIDNISEVDKIVYGIELSENVPADRVITSNIKSVYGHTLAN
jgi:hypothetical protein